MKGEQDDHTNHDASRAERPTGEPDWSPDEEHREIVVVTADRNLAKRVDAANATVLRPNWQPDQFVD